MFCHFTIFADMWSTTFELANIQGRNTLIMPSTDLQISIYDLNTEEFIPNEEKLQLYGDYYGSSIAFEFTLKENQWEDIPAALRWFARYINYQNMELTTEAPKQEYHLRVVR
jgi:hypothetical protein